MEQSLALRGPNGSGSRRGRGRTVALIAGLIAVLAGGVVAGCVGASPSPTVKPNVVTPSGSVDQSSLPSVSANPSASDQSAPPSPGQTAATATVTFNELVLDTSSNATGAARTFVFQSDGPGTVSVQVVSATTASSTKLCLAVDSGSPNCVTGVAPSFPSEAVSKDHSTWTATLISADEATPTVDLTISWPTSHPSVAVTHGLFDGSPNPDAQRSLTATFTARAAGPVSLQASWTPGAVDAALTLSKQPTMGALVDQAQYKAATSLGAGYSHAVDSGATYRITLTNDSTSSTRTNLTATLSFP